MDYDTQLKVQTYLDGELSPDESRDIANLLARDRDAVALLGELRNTRQALVGTEIGVTLPESREFFWSKVQREIEFQEKRDAQSQTQPPPAFSLATLLHSWRKLIVPSAALSALALAAIMTLSSGSHVSLVETAVADPGAFTYHDFSTDTTLVWFSYPAEEEGTADGVR
jgi:anti-sigma factor RsiW